MIFYAYIWLRENGTPYYVGKGSGNRAFTKCRTRGLCPPKNRSGIVVLNRSNETEAFATEKELIANWGRTDLGIGCLHNYTDGGDGAAGYKHTAEHRAKRSAWMMGNKHACGSNPAKALIGEKNPKAKLTEETVSEIRRLYSAGAYRQQDLADVFGVNQQSISHVVTGITWRRRDNG